MRTLAFWFSLLLSLTTLTGCVQFKDGTRGELGHVRLSWADGVLTCLLGCDAHGTLALGATAHLQVRKPSSTEGLTASSPDDSLRVDLGTEGNLTVTALREGEGILEFYRDGELFDRFRWEVRAVQEVSVPPLRLVESSGTSVAVGISNDGTRLVGRGALELNPEATDESVAAASLTDPADALASIFAGANSEHLSIEGRAPGETMLEMEAVGGASFALPVRVFAETEVDAIELEVSYTDSEGGRTGIVSATAFVGELPLLTAPCAWSASEGARLDGAARSGRVEVAGEGEHTVTCTLGGISASTAVRL